MSGFFCLQWHITNRCDQRCRHCYIFNSKNPIPSKEWTLEDAKLLINDYLGFCGKYDKTPHISLTGGDPILHPDFWKIIGLLHEKEIQFSILGNPFHLSPGAIIRLKEAGCKSYQVSLDGLRGTHDSMRMEGSFDSTIKAIELLNEYGLSPAVMTTASRVNWEEIPELTKIIVNHKAKQCSFARYCPTHGDTESNLTPDEYHIFLNRMWDVYHNLEGRGTTFYLKDHLWKIILKEKSLLLTEDDGIVYDGCHCGIAHLTLLEDGTFYACRRFDSPIGNFPTPIEDIFFGEKEDWYRQIHKIDGCSKCELLNYCRGCRAVAFGTSGDYFAKDPQCWLK
ncbi:radical SAM/SPASM domain protein, ACGX system [Candidatus Saccharibacteria bacterium]|nr:radical SAM/SPASM domain protein, ACGX system [Candidatus Saccharibacteria bacterium]